MEGMSEDRQAHRPFLFMMLVAVLGMNACGPKLGFDLSQPREAWDWINDPGIFRTDYTRKLMDLPLTGESEVKPWADSYWPSYRGGLADRWNWEGRPEDPFTYKLHTKDEISRMPLASRSRLSPAEKYDILLGDFTFGFVRSERSRTAPGMPAWYGLCHGWAIASLNFKEPRAVVVKSAEGLEVPFGSSDVKALLTFAHQHERSPFDGRMLGARCYDDLSASSANALDPECRDLNAGSFHIVVTNQLGRLKQGFVGDLTRDVQIWNFPIWGFSSKLLATRREVPAGAAPGTVEVVDVQTILHYVGETQAQWQPAPWRRDSGQNQARTYEYTLEIDAAGDIIGGQWRQEDRPDFFWMQKPPRLDGRFKELKRVYEAATTPATREDF